MLLREQKGSVMKFAKKDDEGNVLGHFEATDDDVKAQKIWTLKVRGTDEEREREGASIQPPKDMKLLTLEKGANDEFGSHDLYVFGTDEIEYVESKDEEETTPRIGRATTKAPVVAAKPKETLAHPSNPA